MDSFPGEKPAEGLILEFSMEVYHIKRFLTRQSGVVFLNFL
jgi:hypothetical protein